MAAGRVAAGPPGALEADHCGGGRAAQKQHSPRWGRSKLQRIETRSYPPQPAEVEHLAAVYEVSADETAGMVRMAREARQKGWWQSSALPKHYQTMVGLEQAASTIREGVQTALLSARLADAAAAGCDIAVITTQPGSKSQQNAQRRGFDLLYTRAILVKPPTRPNAGQRGVGGAP